MSFENTLISVINAIQNMDPFTLNQQITNLTDEKKQQMCEAIKMSLTPHFPPELSSLMDTMFPKIFEELGKMNINDGNIVHNMMHIAQKVASDVNADLSKSVSQKDLDLFDEYFVAYEMYLALPENALFPDKVICFIEYDGFYEAYSTATRGPKLIDLAEKLNIILAEKEKDGVITTILAFPKVLLHFAADILANNDYRVYFVKNKLVPAEIKQLVSFECKNCAVQGVAIESVILLECGHPVCKNCSDSKVPCNVCKINESMTLYI
ncbi:MAG: hypothetical protein Harvfovirus1_45 [Harvfovirus sp.]|uniref:RING-type domain-containing protein n=1 Tax=Harvfovirus sp. TaxID=2487768 RepID=A0A3G4ZZX4_9VIRU|nr:MAG: hypothetical protein Harvfovirus1_45 [Harvfovirus sp.]